jgi:AI-2 transport protein TqsA
MDNPVEREARAERRRTAAVWLIAAIAVVIVGWALRATATVTVPLVFSIFLALLVAPLDRWVADRVPDRLRWLGHVAAMAAILVALLIFVGSIGLAAQQVVTHFPMPDADVSLLPDFGSGSETDAGTTSGAESSGGDGSVLDRLWGVVGGAGVSLGDTVARWASATATSVMSAAGTTLAAATLIFFLTLLWLIEAPQWQGKLATVADGRQRRDAFESVAVIAARLRGYLLARTILGLATAALYVGWLWIFDVRLLIVWGLLAFFLNFIPTLGSLIAGLAPVAFAFFQKDFSTAVLVGAGILVIEQVMGNFIDPKVQGRQVSLSPLVILITLLLWGWIWGIAGAVLAVPITIAFVIVAAHVGPLRPFALFLSNEEDFEALERMASHAPGS